MNYLKFPHIIVYIYNCCPSPSRPRPSLLRFLSSRVNQEISLISPICFFFNIAQKYKLYAKLRSGITTISQPSISSPSSHSSAKRPCPAPAVQTPQKRTKHTHHHHRPSGGPLPSEVLDEYDPPHSARKSPVLLLRTSIGPTPQKDGKVLGLFDFLSPASSGGSGSGSRLSSTGG